ncbi:MAG: UvrB/UvrC motif-containing protein [Bacilli bacterium]
MLCEQCGERPATVHFTEIVQGQKSEFHLCESCAREKGQAAYEAMVGAFSVNQLLSGLLHFDPTATQRADAPASRCENCGLTFQQFAQIGRFGCPNCYQAFSHELGNLLKRVQSSDQHTGKIPRRRGGVIGARRELSRLRQEMHMRVVEERFEEAAQLRDRIRSLEQQLESQV